jgi:integrase
MPEYSIGRLRGRLCLVIWRDGKRQRHDLGTTDPREAERLAPSLYAELTKPKGGAVVDLWDAYCRDREGRAVVATMRHTWKALRSRFGRFAGGEITVADCRAHVAERRARGIADGTIHTELGHLRTVLRWAERRGLLERAPHIERPSKPKPRERHLTREEARALIEAATFPHVRLSIILALGTGARVAALLGLTWNRCDFDKGQIDLRDPSITQPHKGRAIVPMNRTVRAALQGAKQGALTPFVIEWAGHRVGSVKRGLKRAAALAGLSDVSPHVLRHSAAVHMAEAGVPMEEIAQYLGHADVGITRRVYARFSPTYLRQAASVLEYDDLRFIEPEGASHAGVSALTTLDNLVGATGIEPVTPTMSTKRSRRN